MRILKNYRLPEAVIEKLDDLKEESGKDATEIIEAVINYAHQELEAARTGCEHDILLLAQVLGKRIGKSRKDVKTAS